MNIVEFLSESKSEKRKLSKVKKKMAPHMWVISKDSAGGYLVTIGDPRKTGSKTKFRTSDKDEIRHWAKYEMPDKVSQDHVFDATGMKLVPDVYSQWFVDNMMGGKKSRSESVDDDALVEAAAKGKVEKGIMTMLKMGLDITGQRDWFPIEHVARNFRGLKSDTVEKAANALAKKGLVDVKGGKVKLAEHRIAEAKGELDWDQGGEDAMKEIAKLPGLKLVKAPPSRKARNSWVYGKMGGHHVTVGYEKDDGIIHAVIEDDGYDTLGEHLVPLKGKASGSKMAKWIQGQIKKLGSKKESVDLEEVGGELVEAKGGMTKRKLMNAMKKAGISGKFGGSGASWQVEVSAGDKKKLEKLLGKIGYTATRAGHGGWVFKAGSSPGPSAAMRDQLGRAAYENAPGGDLNKLFIENRHERRDVGKDELFEMVLGTEGLAHTVQERDRDRRLLEAKVLPKSKVALPGPYSERAPGSPRKRTPDQWFEDQVAVLKALAPRMPKDETSTYIAELVKHAKKAGVNAKKAMAVIDKSIKRSKAARTVESLEEARFVIGAGGLQTPGGGKVSILPNREYYLGASSSPKHIVVTKVSDDRVTYRAYPYEKDHFIEKWIAADLIEKGTTTALSRRGKWMDPAEKRSYEDLLKGGKGRKVNLKDFERVVVLVGKGKGHESKDLWRDAEMYGGVGGLAGPSGDFSDKAHDYRYEISTDRKTLKKLKADKKFVVLSVKKR